MDKILQQLAGGVVVGTNKLDSSNTNATGFIEWIFRRDTLNQPRERLGITFKNQDELRLIVINDDPSTSLAASVKLQSNRYFVATVNGRLVSTTSEFWNIISSSLDCRVQLFDASPIDDLLVKISQATTTTQKDEPKDDDEDEIDFSPTIAPAKAPTTKHNNNNGEPNYEALLAKDPVRYGFLKFQHPLHLLWRSLRDKTIKARDALLMLEQQVEQDHAKKMEQQVADAAALLDFDSDDDQDNATTTNSKTSEANNSKKHHHHHFGNDTTNPNTADAFFTSPEQHSHLPHIRFRETEQIEGAIKYSANLVPPPPTSTPPFVAFTIRAEQARKLYGSQI